jgi:hypothetical protein
VKRLKIGRRLLFFELCVITAMAQTNPLVGEWHGTLTAGPAKLRLALHFFKGSGTAYTGSMDSLDQGARGIPLSSIKMDGNKLSFEVESIRGTYDGVLKGDMIAGTWRQGDQGFPLEFQRGAFPKVERKPGKPSDIDGAWSGALDSSFKGLRVVLNIANMEDGLSATLDSPDQDAKGIPATITRNGDIIKFEAPAVGGSFEGKLDAKKETIDGTFSQFGKSSPLKLLRGKDVARLWEARSSLLR